VPAAQKLANLNAFPGKNSKQELEDAAVGVRHRSFGNHAVRSGQRRRRKRHLNVWWVAAAGFFRRTKTAPAMSVEELTPPRTCSSSSADAAAR
jgi:hypothetical protein